ncbi:nucleotidyltransferase family protein [Candidatus Woesearchaeota archaeon]|nr:nucleotidyltransferase family protein [Candidatus Woesearchaeota archaeon]
MKKDIDVILLAAGYSTRLYPLTKNFPKPLLEVGGKPVITNIVEKLEPIKEINKVYVVTNNRYCNHFVRWKDNLKTKLDIKIINDGTLHEEDKLGAIGDINLVLSSENINSDVLIIAGDNLFSSSLNPVYDYFKEKNENVIVIVELPTLEQAKKHGVVDLDRDSKIISLIEKPENPKSKLIAHVVYLLKKKSINKIKLYLNEGNNPDAPGYFLQWLYKKDTIYGVKIGGKYFDIGTPETLEKARKEFISSSS